jgi:hypothetical protein
LNQNNRCFPLGWHTHLSADLDALVVCGVGLHHLQAKHRAMRLFGNASSPETKLLAVVKDIAGSFWHPFALMTAVARLACTFQNFVAHPTYDELS